MRATLRPPLALLLVLGALSGCSQNNPLATNASGTGATTDDQTQVTSELSQQPGVVEDGISDSEGQTSYGSETSGLAAIRPLNWWRTIRERNRRFEFAFADTDSTGRPTRVIVTIHTRLLGRFNIAVAPPPPEDNPTAAVDDRVVIHKPLDEVRVRRVLLRRVRQVEGERPRWRVAAVSGVEVTSRDHTTEIASVRVQSGPLDTTITRPLAFIRLRNLLKFLPDTEVRITATTGRNDDVLVLHLGDRRLRMHNNGDNTYSVRFLTGEPVRGLRHFGVDALSNGTLFDDELPYDSQRWVLPFVVAPEELDGPPV